MLGETENQFPLTRAALSEERHLESNLSFNAGICGPLWVVFLCS